MNASKWSLLWPILLTILVPLAAAWFAYPAHLPPNFGVFPPVQVPGTPGFNLWYFLAVLAVALVIAALIIFPSWFGFAGSSPQPAPAKKPLPWWFWVGGLFMVVFWWVMWARPASLGPIVYYAFSPMWWGFIVFLDGINYRMNDGKSLIATKPGLMIFSAIISIVGWGYFEFYDYFVLANWYYPNGHMSALSHSTIVILFLIAYTTVWPAIMEWFNLLNAFPKLVARYQNGWQFTVNGNWLIVIGLIVIAVMVFFPYPVFWGIWIGPMAVIIGLLIRLNIWSPFTSMQQGNWAPLILIALASLFNGFLWELWNYGSSHPDIGYPTNPNYWIYDIPYVNVIHIFSEMPLLGYFGYLPFGALVWVFLIWIGELFNVSTDIYLDGNPN
ncbi:mechanosensitive ion channel protein MscS [Saccharospirillum mangrovi]|uniref:mechanosensitive ion channel protein MscS n=1 Tax=Saccharospirillum mangrovi TaxID=2161747 RepID=UPI000D35F27A|nr:mechanosensitive ion channel protein MscS [Saccharospirillum mangrovi]